MSDITMIDTIVKAIGPVGSAIAIFLVILMPYVLQFVNLLMRRKEKNKTIDIPLEIKTLKEKFDTATETISDNQAIMIDVIRSSLEVVQAIEYKLKSVLSQDDAMQILKILFRGSFHLKFIELSMEYTVRLQKRLISKDDIPKYKMEITNLWSEFLFTLDEFRSPVKLGKTIKENFSNDFTDFLNQITHVVFNDVEEDDMAYMHEQLRAIYNKFYSNILEVFNKKFSEYMKLGLEDD